MTRSSPVCSRKKTWQCLVVIQTYPKFHTSIASYKQQYLICKLPNKWTFWQIWEFIVFREIWFNHPGPRFNTENFRFQLLRKFGSTLSSKTTNQHTSEITSLYQLPGTWCFMDMNSCTTTGKHIRRLFSSYWEVTRSGFRTNRNSWGSQTRALSRILVVVLAAVKSGCKVPNQRTQET